jgi:hypothetical protein
MSVEEEDPFVVWRSGGRGSASLDLIDLAARALRRTRQSHSLMDEYLTAHYSFRPIVPPTLAIERLAQTGAWLNRISRGFIVKTVLALIEGAQVYRPLRPRDTFLLEAQSRYLHPDGATMRAEARLGSELVATVERIVYAHEVVYDEAFAHEQCERLRYDSDGLRPPEEVSLAHAEVSRAR